MRQLAQRLQFGELRRVAGVGHAARAQPVAQRKADIVLLENLANLIEVLVEQILLVILHHPFGQNRPAAAHDSGNALGGERNVLHQHAGVNGHVIHALLGLLFDHFQHHVDVQILHAAHAGERFIDRHGADRNRRSVDDGFADARDIAAGGKIHDGVGAVLHRVMQLGDFFVDVRSGGRVPDVGVDLAAGLHADAHRLQVGVMDIGRNDHAAPRHFRSDQFAGDVLALGDIFHFLGDDALARVIHLRPDRIVHSRRNPWAAHTGHFSAVIYSARANAKPPDRTGGTCTLIYRSLRSRLGIDV